MKKELQAQLDNLEKLVGSKDHPAYIQLETALKEADKVPKSEWNDPELHERMQEAK